jgi:hypothetical protein
MIIRIEERFVNAGNILHITDIENTSIKQFIIGCLKDQKISFDIDVTKLNIDIDYIDNDLEIIIYTKTNEEYNSLILYNVPGFYTPSPIVRKLAKDIKWEKLEKYTSSIINKIIFYALSFFQYNSTYPIDELKYVKDIFIFTAQKKDFHSVAGNMDALAIMHQNEYINEYKTFIAIQTIIEFALIDINDSLETLEVRAVKDSIGVYSQTLLNIFTNNTIDVNIYKDLEIKLKLHKLVALNSIQMRLITLVNELLYRNNLMNSKVLIRNCLDVLKGYSLTEIVMHSRDKVKAKEYLKDYVNKFILSYNGRIPSILNLGNMFETWRDAFGSPLGESSQLFAKLTLKSNISDEHINLLHNFYLIEIPWVHVLLDDLTDIKEDIINGDPNIVVLLKNNLDQYELEQYLNNIWEIIEEKINRLSKIDHLIFSLQLKKLEYIIKVYLGIFEHINREEIIPYANTADSVANFFKNKLKFLQDVQLAKTT